MFTLTFHDVVKMDFPTFWVTLYELCHENFTPTSKLNASGMLLEVGILSPN